ncbi:MAG TPA: hypothetical protein VNB06_17070, partial [Thermoanaerobaculia bacterium]|nr:hypothetical protein [Thermoanaerobaculia bacterium]
VTRPSPGTTPTPVRAAHVLADTPGGQAPRLETMRKAERRSRDPVDAQGSLRPGETLVLAAATVTAGTATKPASRP